MLTHLFYIGLKDLAHFVEGHILTNTLECLHIIFGSFSSQLQYCNINKDIKVYFSNESYNEE